MNCYTNLFSPLTYQTFSESSRDTSGFRERQFTIAERINPGDQLICYMTKLSRWVGILEVLEGPFIDRSPIFYPEDDPFIVRFSVRPVVWLKKEYAIPIKEDFLWNSLSFTQGHDKGKSSWTGKVRSSLNPLDSEDGELLIEALWRQAETPIEYPLSEDDLRKFTKRQIKRADRVVPVSVPDNDTDEIEILPVETEIRESIQIQAILARIGAKMGFSIWIPANDQSRVFSLLEEETQSSITTHLPLNYDHTTIETIERIDVLWLKGRAIARAFEVEHTTAIYSGILRMADLAALQPNMNIKLHIVAPDERRDQVFREISRPVFTLLEKGPLYEYCTYISYESIRDLEHQPFLEHMSDSVIERFEEEADF